MPLPRLNVAIRFVRIKLECMKFHDYIIRYIHELSKTQRILFLYLFSFYFFSTKAIDKSTQLFNPKIQLRSIIISIKNYKSIVLLSLFLLCVHCTCTCTYNTESILYSSGYSVCNSTYIPDSSTNLRGKCMHVKYK